MSRNKPFRVRAAAGLLILASSCGPEGVTGNSKAAGTVGGTANFARSSEQVSKFNYRLPSQDSFEIARLPLALQWTTPSTLDADYNVQFCKSGGTGCRTELTVLCAGRYLCGVKLADGTQISDFSMVTTGATTSSQNHTFTLTLCGYGPGSTGTATELRIQPLVAGKAGTVILGGADSAISGGTCPLN